MHHLRGAFKSVVVLFDFHGLLVPRIHPGDAEQVQGPLGRPSPVSREELQGFPHQTGVPRNTHSLPD